MRRRRPNRENIRDLMAYGHPPVKGKGGWPDKIRRFQKLMLEAAAALEPWGKGGADRRQIDLEDFLARQVNTAPVAPPVSAEAPQ